MNKKSNYIINPQITHGELLDCKDALKYHGSKRKHVGQKLKGRGKYIITKALAFLLLNKIPTYNNS